MLDRSFLVLAAILGLTLGAGAARAGSFKVSVSGELVNSFNATTCGDAVGDAYDDFCPSGACRCEVYEGHASGNRIGKASDVALHLTIDQGSSTSSPGCSPVFGELQLSGSKDQETINLNGSFCEPLGNASKANAKQQLRGGFGVATSSGNVNAFGTVSGSFDFNAIGYKLKLSGRTP
jgi:hypothetical protein